MRNGSFRQNPALFILSLVFGLIGGLFFTGGLIGILVLTNGLTVTDPRSINPMLMLPAIFASMGALFLGVVVIIRVIAAKKRRKRQDLIANGRCVSAMVTDIVVDASVVVNGRPSRRVECCYTDAMTGKTYLYQSERLFSTATLTLTDLRKRTSPENLEKLLFLKSNMPLEGYSLRD